MMGVRICAGILQKAMGWREYWEQQPQAGFVYAHYGIEGGMAAAELKVACMHACRHLAMGKESIGSNSLRLA